MPEPPVVAYYWNGAAPKPHRLRDISVQGGYLLTEERWYPGTLVQMTLGPENLPETIAPEETKAVRAKVIWHGTDGVGVQFLHASREDRSALEKFLKHLSEVKAAMPASTDEPEAVKAIGVAASASQSGHALVEFALILPLIFVLIVNAVNFATFIYAWTSVANAARTGVQYAVLSGSSVGMPTAATAAQIQTLITNDTSSMLNKGSIQVRVCSKYNGTTTCSGTGSGTTPSDPEATYYKLMAVDITFTYQPVISLWSFPRLSIYSTIPPTTIHKTAVMRMIQ